MREIHTYTHVQRAEPADLFPPVLLPVSSLLPREVTINEIIRSEIVLVKERGFLEDLVKD